MLRLRLSIWRLSSGDDGEECYEPPKLKRRATTRMYNNVLTLCHGLRVMVSGRARIRVGLGFGLGSGSALRLGVWVMVRVRLGF